MADKQVSDKVTSVIAKEDNGNVQINFTIPFNVVKKAQDEVIKELAKDIEVPGFRKGKAPLDKAAAKIPQNTLIEHSLSHILPEALSEAITKNKLQIAIYPKFELISAKDNEPWQIRGITCELPKVELGGYKKAVEGALRSGSIIVPGKDKKEATREEKEETVLKTLLDTVKIKIPQILVEEEANSRISNLLSRLEKLGVPFESYLTSIGKKITDLRADYEKQAKDAIAIDLILSKVAEEENIKTDPKEIDNALAMSQAAKGGESDNGESEEDRKRLIESILKRRSALDFLIKLG